MARKPRAVSSYSNDTTLDAYAPSRQSEYLYVAYTSPTDARVMRWQAANDTSRLPSSAEYAVLVMQDRGLTYEQYLDGLTRADMASKFSLDGKPTPGWAGGSKQAYHRAVRANQRRIDGQTPVEESMVRIPGVPVTLEETAALTQPSSGESQGGGGSGTGLAEAKAWASANKPVLIGAAAIVLLVLFTRKR